MNFAAVMCIMGIAVQLNAKKTEKTLENELKIDESRHDLAFSFLYYFFNFFFTNVEMVCYFPLLGLRMQPGYICVNGNKLKENEKQETRRRKTNYNRSNCFYPPKEKIGNTDTNSHMNL